MFPELLIEIPTKDKKIANDCKKVGKMLPLLKDKKLSIEDLLTIHSD